MKKLHAMAACNCNWISLHNLKVTIVIATMALLKAIDLLQEENIHNHAKGECKIYQIGVKIECVHSNLALVLDMLTCVQCFCHDKAPITN